MFTKSVIFYSILNKNNLKGIYLQYFSNLYELQINFSQGVKVLSNSKIIIEVNENGWNVHIVIKI